MCGIAGFLGPPGVVHDGVVDRLLSALRLRGPDDRGVHRTRHGDAELVLCNTRLAILDLSPGGHLPMVDGESGTALAYNGEVYAHLELRSKLLPGERWRSTSDSETVHRILDRFGIVGLRHLDGMFAIAHWDAGRGELLLARDRVGEKPLYWAEVGGGVLFASEVEALLATDLIDRTVDMTGVATYLANGFVTSPTTLVRGVRSLPPATYLRSTTGRALGPTRYWFLPEERPPSRRDSARTPAGIAPLLLEAIAERTASDRPVGVFLSSGIDSVTIAATLAERGEKPSTVTLSVQGDPDDEAPAARAIAERLGTSHHEVSLPAAELTTAIDRGVRALDQPSFDGINSALVSQVAARLELTVLLSGAGGDELFGGYPFLRFAAVLDRLNGAPVGRGAQAARTAMARGQRLVSTAPAKLLDGLHGGDPAVSAAAAYQAANAMFPTWARRVLLPSADPLPYGLPDETLAHVVAELHGRDPLGTWTALAWRLFLGERVLRDVDAVSMAESIEVRTPYTDVQLVEAVMSLPGSVRAANPPSKAFQREMVGPLVRELVTGPKRGFTAPVDRWLGTPDGREWATDRVRSTAVRDSALDDGAVGRLCGRWEDGKLAPNRIWTLAVLLDWCVRNRMTW